MAGVDTLDINIGGGTHFLYRPDGIGDGGQRRLVRPAVWVNDYTWDILPTGEWLNFTRHFPAGTYNVYGEWPPAGETPPPPCRG